MIRHLVVSAILAGTAVLASHPASAQGLEPGAMAGRSYLPSTHTKGCSGLMCDSDDPRRMAVTATGAPAPPPPCQGLICGMSPYGMGRPVTAAEAQRMQEEQARAAAAAPAPAAEPAPRKRSAHRKKKTAKTVAARTPDPASKATPVASGAPQ